MITNVNCRRPHEVADLYPSGRGTGPDHSLSRDIYARLGYLLDETFESVHGIYLDKGTSLRETLAAVPAEVASRPVSRRGTSVVAHDVHLTFYLDLLGRGLRGEAVGPVDWEET